jgi:protein-L-isoaspartate(D-aspartate) O-methyltransferase
MHAMSAPSFAATEADDDLPVEGEDGQGARTLAFLLALRAQGVNDRSVLRAMERVPRERFAPQRFADLARTDISIPLPCGQMMTPPTRVAQCLVALGPVEGQRVLEVGTGSGYVSALLAAMGARVVSLERYRSLAIAAYERFAAVGVRGIDLQQADGLRPAGLLGHFDAILLNGSVEMLPPPLLGLLAPGGRLVAPLRQPGGGTRLVTALRGAGRDPMVMPGPAMRLPALVPGLARAL